MARLQLGSPALSPQDEGNCSEEPSPEEQRRGRLPLGGQALEEIPANVVNWRCLNVLSVNILKAKRRAVSAGHARRGRIAGGAHLRAAALGCGCVSSRNQFTLATVQSHAQLSSKPEQQEPPGSSQPGPFSCGLHLDWFGKRDAQYWSCASR